MDKSSSQVQNNTETPETNKSAEKPSASSQNRKRRLPSSYSVGALKCVAVLPGLGNCDTSSSDNSSSDEDEISVKSEVVRWKSFVCGQSGKVFTDSLGRKLQFAPANKKN